MDNIAPLRCTDTYTEREELVVAFFCAREAGYDSRAASANKSRARLFILEYINFFIARTLWGYSGVRADCTARTGLRAYPSNEIPGVSPRALKR